MEDKQIDDRQMQLKYLLENRNTPRETTMTRQYLPPFEKGTALQEKNSLLLGANSFLHKISPCCVGIHRLGKLICCCWSCLLLKRQAHIFGLDCSPFVVHLFTYTTHALSREVTLIQRKVMLPFEKRSTLSGENLLPMGANSFFCE